VKAILHANQRSSIKRDLLFPLHGKLGEKTNRWQPNGDSRTVRQRKSVKQPVLNFPPEKRSDAKRFSLQECTSDAGEKLTACGPAEDLNELAAHASHWRKSVQSL
jgi:hypothetical protein